MNNEVKTILKDTMDELIKANIKHPNWPNDILHAMQVVNEEVGELNRELLMLVYEPDRTDFTKVRKEAIQSLAMLVRFLYSFDNNKYELIRSPQHQH